MLGGLSLLICEGWNSSLDGENVAVESVNTFSSFVGNGKRGLILVSGNPCKPNCQLRKKIINLKLSHNNILICYCKFKF